MSLLNPLAREISAKVVYYGPGLSGKTTTLKYIHSTVKPTRRGELVTLATEGDRTIFFDFLPLHVERVHEMGVRLQLYTVPGQVFYAATRKLVLNGADGVVFVADSQRQCRDANLESYESLRSNLQENGQSLENLPHVIQYNKRDLSNILSIQELHDDLNLYNAPEFSTAATNGTGVHSALKEIIRLVIRSLWKKEVSASPPSSRTLTGRSRDDIPALGSSPTEDSIAARLSGLAESLANPPVRDPDATPLPTAEIPVAPVPNLPEPTSATAGSTPEDEDKEGFSFSSMWEGPGVFDVRGIEAQIARGDYAEAVRRAAMALAELLDSLPGPTGSDGPKAQAALLGLDGREYLKLCRLAGAPKESLTEESALFSLYLLVAAKIKARSI